MIQVFNKEVSNFLNSLTAYIVIVVFLTIIGLLMWVFPDTSILEYGFADMFTLFRFGPYVLMFLVPAITMKMFAEEKKNGTFEILFTRPLSDNEIILGKYLAAMVLVLLSIAPTLLYFFSIYQLGNPQGNIDAAGTAGSYIGLVLLGGVFASIGIFASSMTENQVVAFILSIFLCFILYDGFQQLPGLQSVNSVRIILEKLSIAFYYNDLSKGLINLNGIVYLLSVILFMLILTKLVIGSRKW
ncbi:MAG TPA: gliding motility-associated ABC transporter permease subunit GldF [Cyclobacteriaceae bacterium]|nr:gliding motility-associated ABC transporter permease subunit GldF [Cyclobacteriaceae bacterium]